MFERALTPAVKNLLILNFGVFVAALLINFPMVASLLAFRHFSSSDFQIYQILTYMFMHANGGHIFMNMLLLFFAGPLLERVWGAKRFLIYYILCGIGAALLYTSINAYQYDKIEDKINTYRTDPNPHSYEIILYKDFRTFVKDKPEFFEGVKIFEKNPENEQLKKESIQVLETLYTWKLNTQMIGASGAVMGVIIGMALLFPNTIVTIWLLNIPIKIKYLAIIMIAADIYGIYRPDDNVAHFAHIGGLITGYLIIVYWRRNRERFY